MRVRLEDIASIEEPQAQQPSTRRVMLDEIVSVESPPSSQFRRVTLDEIVSVEPPEAAAPTPAPRQARAEVAPNILEQLRASLKPVASHARTPPPAAPATETPARAGIRPAPFKTTLSDRMTDLGRSFMKGLVSVPEAAIGLGNLVSGGRAGQVAEAVGIRPQQWREEIDRLYPASEASRQANAAVQDADGIAAKAAAALTHPSVIAESVVEAVPPMAAGGVVGRGLTMATRAPAWAAGAVGEGVIAAGQSAEQIRQQSPDGRLTGGQSAIAAGSGALTSILGAFGGKLAERFGLTDVNTLLASAATKPRTQRSIVTAVVAGAVQEGFLEELPQSVQETVAQNLALGRPLETGVDEAAVMGALAGAAMGGAAQFTRPRNVLDHLRAGRPGGSPESAPAPVEAPPTRRTVTLDDIVAVEPPPSDAETGPILVSGATAPATRRVTLDEIASVDESPSGPPRVTEMAPDAIRVDPQRFQFKSDADAAGVTRGNKIEGPWNDTISGVLLVWQDPADGQTYVVNGHHRLEAAKRLGAERVAVRYVQAPSAEDAKLAGALTNIAEDKGTPVDAAKVLRSSPDAAATLAKAGVSRNTRLARDGAALAQLSDPLFQRVATGALDEGFGVAIGEGQLSPEDQAAVVTLIERQQAKGRELTARQVRALIQDVKSAPAVSRADDQMSMFTSLLGEDRAQSVAVEKAVLRDWLMSTLAKDKRLFGYVSKGDRAERLAAAGNVIDVDASRQQAQQAATVADVVERLAQSSGPVSAALTQAATRLAAGENVNAVRTELLEAARAAVDAELSGRPDVGSGPVADLHAGAVSVPSRAAGAADRRGDRGAADLGRPDANAGDPVANVLEALEGRFADRLPTGELQPRLPGDVGSVRDREISQPKVAELPQQTFELTPPDGDEPSQGALFEPRRNVLDHLRASASKTGSPTRRLYDTERPTAKPEFRGRAVSEPQVVARIQDVFSRPQRSKNVLERLALGSGGRQLPVRAGRHPLLKRYALGLYFPKTTMLRLKKSGDLATFSHELGHHIDFALFEQHGRPTGLFRGELLKLGEATTPPNKLNTKYHVAEGVAEFFRVWFADPVQARAEAPNFTAALEDVMRDAPGFSDQLLEAQGLVRRYLAQPMAVRGAARVSVAPAGMSGRAKDVLSELRTNRERGSWTRRFVYALRDTGNLPGFFQDRRAWWDAQVSRWTDRHQAIWRALHDYAPNLPAAVNAYTLTRLADKSPAMAEGALRWGPRGMDGRFLGPGLEAVLRPVHDRLYPPIDQPDKPSLVTYLIAMRAQELRSDGKGRDPGMSAEEALELIARTRQDPDFERIEKAAKGVYGYLKGLRRYALEYGGLSADQVRSMEEATFYVPLQRVRDIEEGGVAPGATKYADRQSPIKRLFGSGRDIVDPIESIVRYSFAMTSFVERNQAAAALARVISEAKGGAAVLTEIDPLKDATTFNLQQVKESVLMQLISHGFMDPAVATGGLVSGKLDEAFDHMATIFTPSAFGKPGERILFVVDGGKRRFFQVQDEALYQNLVALGPGTTRHIFELAGGASALLRAGVTMRPTFIVRNLIRDTLGALFQSRHGLIPVWDTARGFLSQLKKDDHYRRYMAFGIQQSTLLGNDRQTLRAAIDKATKPQTWKSRLFRPVTAPLDFVQQFSAAVETATRLGEFRLAVESGGRERRAGVLGIAQRLTDRTPRPESGDVDENVLRTAALAAADVTVDFSRGGTLAKEVSSISAFFNARVQGLVRAGETFERDPLGTTLTATSLAALSMILWAWNHDDEVYQEIDAQRKRDYWHVRLPGLDYWLTVPKPFVWSGIANVVEAALDEAATKRPESVQPIRDFANGAGKDLLLQLVPNLMLPTLEALSNWDYYRDRPIVSPFDLKKEPDLQVNDWTSDTFRALGNALGVSPAKLEHWATKTGGGLVRDMTEGTDVAFRRTLLRQQPERPARGVERFAGLQALLSPRRVDSRAASLDAFWSEFERLERAEQSFRAYAGSPDSQGRPTRPPTGQTDAREYGRRAAERFNPLHVLRMKAAKAQLDALYDERDAVYASRELSRDDKRLRVDFLHLQMARIAREALKQGGVASGQ